MWWRGAGRDARRERINGNWCAFIKSDFAGRLVSGKRDSPGDRHRKFCIRRLACEANIHRGDRGLAKVIAAKASWAQSTAGRSSGAELGSSFYSVRQEQPPAIPVSSSGWVECDCGARFGLLRKRSRRPIDEWSIHRYRKGNAMKTICLASACGAALLAVTSFANAQGTGVSANRDQGVTSKQCWDVSSNIIRDRNPTSSGASAADKTPETTVGSTTSGPTGSGASGSTSSTGNASARPAGMPDC